MRDFEGDLSGLGSLINNGSDYLLYGCDRTYKNTNERLKEILEQFDFNQKNVLSVLGSSDQIFSSYYLGASNVDSFDINWTPYYYFYIRKWFLMFYCRYILETESAILLNSLSMYNAGSEEEVKVHEVWEKLLLKYRDISKIFHKNILYDWDVPYSQDIKRLIDSIKNKQANFSEIDIFADFQTERKYDIVILSNILETVYPDDEKKFSTKQQFKKIIK